MKTALGSTFEPDLRALTVEELRLLYHRLNREGYICITAADAAKVGQADILNWAWWNGRAAGVLDAMMIIDGTWDGIDVGFEVWRNRRSRNG